MNDLNLERGYMITSILCYCCLAERATNVSVLSPSTIISEITPTVEGSQRREFLSAQEVKERMKT